MNILFTVFSFQTGGIEKLLIDILNNWKREEDKLYLCVINDDYSKSLLQRVKRKNVEIILLHKPRGKQKIKYLIKYIRTIIDKKINIIHCQSGDVLIFSSIVKLLQPKIKIFHTIHDTKIYLNYSKIIIFLDKIISENIIAISEVVKKDIIVRGIDNDKIVVIYNGIEIEKFKAKKKPFSNEEINIGCIARIVPEKKGQHILINAIKIVREKYPNIKCYFAGAAPDNKLDNLECLIELTKELDLEDNIFFLGNVENIPLFLSSLDIFVLPSINEGFGISIIEAMASNTPVIASKIEGPKEIIKNERYGYLFEVENYQDLSNKIINVIEDCQNSKFINTYEYINENYSINSVINNLEKIYLE